jgi:hypothetical protein
MARPRSGTSPPAANNDAAVQLAGARNIGFDTFLPTVCAEISRCRFDGNGVFDRPDV